MSIVIKNVTWVNEEQRQTGDVWFQDGRIRKLGGQITVPQGTQEICGEGKVLLPGVIDDQVHFRDFDLSHKATIASESLAAAAGGVTSVMEMPNTRPPTTDWEAWEYKTGIGARDSAVNYAYYIGGTNDNADLILKNIPEGKICGLKLFMGSSTGNMLVDEPSVLEHFFAEWPGLIATHCEDEATIREQTAWAEKKYPGGIPPEAHPQIRNTEACAKSSSFAIDLARRHGTRLHVLHLTTERETHFFDPGVLADKRITSEVCVHHLTFCDEDYQRLGNQIKCNPAIKRKEDREALWSALKQGRIDVIATDHAPHTWEEKLAERYQDAPAGLPLIQHTLGLMLYHVDQGRLTLEEVVRSMAHHPAECYRVKERGYLREGYWADAVLVDLQNKPEVTRQSIHHKCAWSPLEGQTLGGTISHTFVSGQLAYSDGALQKEVRGRALEFLPQS
ncbi:MAG: dihydroorotase [Verrucomicrobiota bacterium]